jgi:DNA-binding transcriptional LysR family regulator
MATGLHEAMDLRRLMYFVAVAEELHFGRAASRLGIAQPPLSRQIAQIECDLGVLLFDRSRSQIRLTQAGETMLERARDVIDRLEQAEQEVRRIGEGSAGRLRVAFVGSAAYGILPNVIKTFRNDYPDIELAISAMNNAELKRALIQREVDIAVARPALEDEELHSQPFHHEPLIVALPDTSPALESDPLELVSLKRETFILYPRKPRPSFADHIINICKIEGFIPKAQIMAQDYQTAISLVSVGVGISLVPESVSRSERTGVTYRPYVGNNPGTSLSLNYRRDNRMPHLQNFLKVALKMSRSTAKNPAPGTPS